MRFYYARIVINRPFLVALDSGGDFSEFSQNVDFCLDAARQTILLIHNAFVNRTYLRTWWYCTTYTLYANMIILYFLLMQFPRVAGEELVTDVEKSLEILTAMRQVVVARRCAELTKEILAVAKKHIQEVRRKEAPDGVVPVPAVLPNMQFQTPDSQIYGENDTWPDTSLVALWDEELPGWPKENILASIYDPNVLEDFAFSEGQTLASLNEMADGSEVPYHEGWR
ncbi:hypothetical protein Plec18167_002792 [Paecilomyces lecythidis]|uniref:Uncharacterized protein n=1 Tax=Paecilomyces lecythidis TaxID=3004212 RepID=A0ABR3Y275_9EURO